MQNYSSWNIKPDDFPTTAGPEAQLAFLCNYAVLAPSVHNVQPWAFEVGKTWVTVKPAPERLLAAGDPTGRETWISLGAAVENLTLAGRLFGYSVKQLSIDSDGVRVEFLAESSDQSVYSKVLAMTERRSHREPYSKKNIPASVLNAIKSSASADDVWVEASSAPELIGLLADLTGKAISIALMNPEFRRELSSLIRHNWTKESIGMPAFSLGVSSPRSIVERRLVRSGLTANAQGMKEAAALKASSAVVLVFGKGDSKFSWVEAGRAYQRAALIATANGLCTATTAAAVEAADFHLDIEEFAGSSGRLLAVMRLGYSDKKVGHSPRIPAQDLITFSS